MCPATTFNYNQMPSNVYVPMKLNHHRRINKIYISHSSQSCRRSQSSQMIQNATKCHEEPCNHQFERRYITPTVTYVEKPNRVLLNPLVSGQLTRFQLFIWEIRWNGQYLRRKLSRITYHAQMKESHNNQKTNYKLIVQALTSYLKKRMPQDRNPIRNQVPSEA